MSPRNEEQYEEMRESSRRKILMAAMELFAEHGFHATSISEIAKKAGVAKGLMYNYFGSKEELLKGIFDQLYKDYDQFLQLDMSAPPHETITWLITEAFEILQRDKKMMRLFTMLSFQNFDFIRSMAMEKMDGYYQMLSILLSRMGHQNPMDEARELGALLDGIGVQYLIVGEEYPIEEMKNYMLKRFVSPPNHKENE